MFSCAFVGARYVREGLLLRNGIIVFNDNAEVFESPIGAWSEDDYEQSWIEAINLITLPQPRRSAIVTGFNGFEASYLQWWPLFPAGSSVIIREQLLFLEQIRSSITKENLFDFVQNRNLDRDLMPSEWSESIDAFSSFGHCLKMARTIAHGESR